MNAEFFRSTFSGTNGTCVEVAHRADVVLIRDSKFTGVPHRQPILEVGSESWPAVLNLVSGGDSGRVDDQLSVKVFADGSATLSDAKGTTLEYNPAEWDAFIKGVANGEFDR